MLVKVNCAPLFSLNCQIIGKTSTSLMLFYAEDEALVISDIRYSFACGSRIAVSLLYLLMNFEDIS